MSFEEWMAQVDRELLNRVEVDNRDLADCPYRDWYDDGTSPREAAVMVLEENDFY